MKIDYTKDGDYFIPNLILPKETRPIGHWGRLHKRYLEETRPGTYSDMVLTCTLWTYLADLNEQATERFDYIMKQMKEAEGATEALKAADQMEWVRRMESIRNRAEEIILHEMIYV